MDVDPVLPRITTPGRGDVGPDHMQTEEDSTIPSSVPVSSAQSSANIPSVKGDLHNYDAVMDDAVDIFAKLHPRRMDLQSIIFHDE